jgi:hypothetical protein
MESDTFPHFDIFQQGKFAIKVTGAQYVTKNKIKTSSELPQLLRIVELL